MTDGEFPPTDMAEVSKNNPTFETAEVMNPNQNPTDKQCLAVPPWLLTLSSREGASRLEHFRRSWMQFGQVLAAAFGFDLCEAAKLSQACYYRDCYYLLRKRPHIAGDLGTRAHLSGLGPC